MGGAAVAGAAGVVERGAVEGGGTATLNENRSLSTGGAAVAKAVGAAVAGAVGAVEGAAVEGGGTATLNANRLLFMVGFAVAGAVGVVT